MRSAVVGSAMSPATARTWELGESVMVRELATTE
jgi:hypothetical protein